MYQDKKNLTTILRSHASQTVYLSLSTQMFHHLFLFISTCLCQYDAVQRRPIQRSKKYSHLHQELGQFYKNPLEAARAVAYLNPILRWAKKRDLVVGDFDLEKPNHAPPKQRVLDETELAAILPFLEDSRGMCARFILLTGARISAA